MTDRVDPVPIDPLRSGGIFRLNKAGLHAHPHVRTPAAAVPPGLELIAGRDSNGAGGVAAVPAPFNAAYSARVRARFNELYRATPIPVSILYDTPIGRMGGMSAASVGSADSNATTVVQSPALVHVSPVVLSMPADKGLGDIQLPVKEVAGTLDLFSPPVSSRRHYRSSRDGSAESAARNATRKLVDEDMVAKSDSLVETVVSTPSPSVAKQAQMGPRAIKRVRPELVSPQSAEQSPAEGKSTGAVRSSTSLAIPAASQLAQAPTGTAAMQSVAVKTVAATSCSREKDAEEEDLGEDDSYGSGSEDEIEDFDGLGEFLERALADADSEEEDKTERKKESNTIANNSVIDRKVNINFVSEQRKVAPQQSASTGMALSRTQTPVSDSRAAVEIKTVMVDVQSPAVYAAPKHALVAQPRGRGAMQVNSFLSNLPPPPAPATKLNSNSLISSSKSTPPPVKADMLVREIHSAPPLEKAAKVLAVQEQKKKSSEPQVHGGLRFVQLRDLSSSSDEDSVGMYPSKTQKKDKSAQKAVASPKLTKKPSMQNGPTDSRKMILESGVIVEASNSSNKKKAPNEVLNETLARATLPNVSKKKAPVANHVVDLHPQQKVLDGDTGTADIRKKKKSPIQVAKVQNQIPKLENECRLSSYIAANIPVILLGGDQSVWSAEELSVLKEAHNLTPLNDPNFWMHVTEIVNEWRKSVHAKNFELRSENGPAKRKGGRKKSDHIVTELPPLVLRTASDCQGRWFQVFLISCLVTVLRLFVTIIEYAI